MVLKPGFGDNYKVKNFAWQFENFNWKWRESFNARIRKLIKTLTRLSARIFCVHKKKKNWLSIPSKANIISNKYENP